MIIESSSEKNFKIAQKRAEIQPFKVESQKLRNFRAHPVDLPKFDKEQLEVIGS